MDSTHEKSPRKERKEGEPEVTAERSPTRCPYCHDACGPEDARARACQQCLSRHHAACWREGGERCASCGSKKALAPTTPDVKVTAKELDLLRRGLPQEAIERVVRRTEVSEADATRALLEAACGALLGSKGLSDNALNAIVMCVLGVGFFIWMIVLAS